MLSLHEAMEKLLVCVLIFNLWLKTLKVPLCVLVLLGSILCSQVRPRFLNTVRRAFGASLGHISIVFQLTFPCSNVKIGWRQAVMRKPNHYSLANVPSERKALRRLFLTCWWLGARVHGYTLLQWTFWNAEVWKFPLGFVLGGGVGVLPFNNT